MRDIFVHYGLGEVWNLITGDIRPSCCVYKYGRLFVPETEVCLGLLSEKAQFPKGYDMKDLGRVERLLEDAGVFKIPEEISLAEVEEKLSKFSDLEKNFKRVFRAGRRNASKVNIILSDLLERRNGKWISKNTSIIC